MCVQNSLIDTQTVGKAVSKMGYKKFCYVFWGGWVVK